MERSTAEYKSSENEENMENVSRHSHKTSMEVQVPPIPIPISKRGKESTRTATEFLIEEEKFEEKKM